METATTIRLTDKAVQRIREVMDQDQGVGGLRLAVQGGGCAGLTYAIKFDRAARPNDHVFEFEGARVFVDSRSLEYLKGLTLDYKADLMQHAFVFFNPNAKQSCSCGTSFTV